MFWRYLFLVCLLGVPSNRIFTSAAVETFEGPTYQDDLVDRIVGELSNSGNTVEGYDKKGGSQGINVPATGGGTVPDTPAMPDSPQGVDTGAGNSQPGNSAGGSAAGGSAAGEPAADEPEQLPEPASQQHQPANGRSGDSDLSDDKYFLMIVGGSASVVFVGLMMAGVCYYKFRKSRKAAVNVEYPAYGVTGPMKERVPSPGDRKLAQSAQMYHYQHQKQQMIAMEKANGDMKHDASDDDSEEDNVEGDYTVYECPGLAPTGEMEVKNPLFRGDETPVTPNREPSAPPQEDKGSLNGAEH